MGTRKRARAQTPRPKRAINFEATSEMRALDATLHRLHHAAFHGSGPGEGATSKMVVADKRAREAARAAHDAIIREVMAKHLVPGPMRRLREDVTPGALVELAVVANHSNEARSLLSLKILRAAGILG
jgi:hypothetical protein